MKVRNGGPSRGLQTRAQTPRGVCPMQRLPERLSSLETCRILARTFTRPVFASIARYGSWRTSLAFLLRHDLLYSCPGRTLSDLFESCWQILRSRYRNEYVYKSEVANRVVFGRHSPRTTALQVELPISRSIVDVAAFNGSSTAYEIKTEFDSSRRLETQTRDYLKAFDRVFVVAHPSTAARFAELVDPRVGVLSLDIRGTFATIRDATSNKLNVVPDVLFRSLRRAEYMKIAEGISGQPFRFPNGIIARKCREQFTKLDPVEAHTCFVAAMRERKTDAQIVSFITRLPQSLRALGYATPLSSRQQQTVLAALEQKIDFAIAAG